MTAAAADRGSFRDPGSRIFSDGGRILRAIMPPAASAYEAARDSGLIADLVGRRSLLASEERDPACLGLEAAPAYVLEHPRLPFVSYPYEWGFALLRRAALHHLDVQLDALAAGFALSDASAYNIQFVGPRPVFIDHGSFRPYVEGEPWIGHRQFCMQFLNPLLLWSRRGVAANGWFRGSLEGIAPEELAPLLSWRDNLSWTVLTHVTGQAALQRRANSGRLNGGKARAPRLSRPAFEAILTGLRGFIARCRLRDEKTVWRDYAQDNSYAGAEAAAKRAFVAEMAAKVRPRLLFDFGCNSGDYARAALDAGAGSVVGFDADHGALERAVGRADAEALDFLPLWLDAANPSPAQGWAEAERKGLGERGRADALLALAFVHHLAIGRNVPLAMVVDWLVGMAPVGIVEFPPKSDPMVRRLLAARPDIFADYDEAAFLAAVGVRARLVRTRHLSPGGRLLAWYDRG